jgi:hypothetical protein
MAQVLPQDLPEHLNQSDNVSEIRSAYSKILLLQRQADAVADPKLREQRLVRARVLGYLIREGPSIQASEYVAKDVNACADDDRMEQLGDIYQLHFIRLCEPPLLRRFCLSDDLLIVKKNKGATPSPSTHPSRPSFETKKDMMMHMLSESGEAPQHHNQAKKKVSHVCTLQATYFLIQTISKALVRDSFRCIATGRYDGPSVAKNQELKAEMYQSRTPTCNTQCSHIFPQSTNVDISGSKEGGAKVSRHVLSISVVANFLLARVCRDSVDDPELFRLRWSSRETAGCRYPQS